MGRTPWTGGDLILSRWDKPLRIVPWEEVADQWAQSDAVQKKIKRYGGIPFKKVSPQMRDLLVERGVKILPPTAKDGKACRQAYEEWMASSDQTRFSLTDEMREIETKAKEGKYLGKAPNGEKSDLETRKQWLEVRTKNFKDFFGDWEASALYKMAQEAISTKQHAGTYRFTPEEKLKKKLENLTGHPINGVIIESSRIIHVDKHHGEGEDQRGQIDITAEDIALLPYYLNNYDAIIPNPQYDTNEGRAYTVYKRINGVVVVGTIEIGKTGMAVATEFKKKVADVQMYNAPELNALDASAIAKVKKEILKLKENFENSSKVVDENGEPLVVYNANAVDADTIGEEVQVPINRFDRDIAHDGFWFTADKEFARRWVEEWMEYDNDRVRACYLNMRNPLVIDAKGADWKDVDGRSTDDWARYAEENGYDGLIVRNVLEGTDSEYTTKLTDSYAVFRPEQIKSATDNNGGFDATNPDIRFSLEDEVAEHKKGEKAFEPTENEKKVVKAMADHLNAIGIETTVDHKEGQRVLDAANGRVKLVGKRGTKKSAPETAENIQYHKVYHGSGSDFDAFDHSHMGEGEGVQAYGWGSYVTEVEGIGRAYAKEMGGRKQPATYKGHNAFSIWHAAPESYQALGIESDLQRDVLWDITESLNYGYGDPVAMIRVKREGIENEIKVTRRRLEKYQEELIYLEGEQKARKQNLIRLTERKLEREQARLDFVNSLDPKDFKGWSRNGTRLLYTVEIPDDNGRNYIDYSGRMGDQREVLDMVERYLTDNLDWENHGHDTGDGRVMLTKDGREIILTPGQSGADMYEELKIVFGAKGASEVLHEAGLTGISYPAEYRSGGREDGARNYVIFDEGDLQITDKVRFFRTADGEAYGFTLGGKIYIDPRIATRETPLHEYDHLWSEALEKANPEAWEHLKGKLREKQTVVDYVKELYPEIEDENELMHEVFSHFSGRRGAEQLKELEEREVAKAKGPINKARIMDVFRTLRDMLKEYWTMARDLFAGKNARLKEMSAEDFADMSMSDFLHKFDPREAAEDIRFSLPGEQEHEEKRKAVEELGEKWHTPVNVIEDVESITHPDAEVQARRRGAKGWYDPKTGEVVVVLANNRNVDDVKATVAHETIDHKGLREMIGEERYAEFLDTIYRHLRGDLKKEVDAAAGRAFTAAMAKEGKGAKSYEEHRRTAVDELFARLAEKPFEEFSEGERTLWQKLKESVRKVLDKFLGDLKLPEWFELGDNELRYILWRSKERLEGKGGPIGRARDMVKRTELGLEDEVRYNMGDAPDTFEARQRRAVENNGTIMPGLNDAQVKVVDVPRHPYKGSWLEAIDAAVHDAIEKYTHPGKDKDGKEIRVSIPQHYNNFGAEFDYGISRKSIEESINEEQIKKSLDGEASRGVHLAVLNHLDNVINESIEVEEHPDYIKKNGKRSPENGYNDNILVHRFVGAIKVDGKEYRVKTTMLEYKQADMASREYAYDVTKIEVLDDTTPNTPVDLDRATKGLLPLAKVIKNLKKSYDSGKRILDESKIADDGSDIRFSIGEDAEDILNDKSLGLRERLTAIAASEARENGEDKALRNLAVNAIGGNLADLRKAMGKQRQYDRTTVKRVADLARILLTNGYLDDMTRGEVKRLVSAVKNSTGVEDVTGSVEKVMDIMVKNMLRRSEALEKANPEAWGHLKEQLLGKEDVLAYVKRRYPELTDENDLMHEVFSHYAGKRGAERLRREAKEEMEKAQGVFSKARVMNIFNTIRKALNRYWTMARNLFAGYNDKLKDMSAEDFADMAMADMLGGFDPRTEIRKREANPHKDAQLRLVVGRNAMEDDYHVGIRSIDDIKTYEEAVREGEGLDSYPDFTREDAERALQEGEITVYSSKPIEQGGFVSTSRMEAKEYAGGGRVYEKRVSLDDVAWIYAGEGQYAKVDEAYSEEKIREIVGDKVTDKNVSRVRGIIPLYNFLGNPKNHEVYAPYRSVHRTPTLNDYYIHTDAKFKAVPTGDRGVADAWQGMKASGKYEHHKSPLSDSEYLIDRESGDIYRMSDHWGRVASCQWDIDNPAEGMQIGKANIKDFKGNNRRGNGYEVDVSNFRTSYFNALDKTVKNLETLLGGGIEIDDAVRGRLERALDFYRTAKENHTVLERDRLFYSLAPDEADTGLWR